MKGFLATILIAVCGFVHAQTVVRTTTTFATESKVISTGTPKVSVTNNRQTVDVKQADGSVVRQVYSLVNTTTTTPTTSQDFRYQIVTQFMSDGSRNVTRTLVGTTVVTKSVVTPSTVRTLVSSTVLTPATTTTTTTTTPTPAPTTAAFDAKSYYGNSPFMGTPSSVFSSNPKDWVNSQFNNGSNQHINSNVAWARGWTGAGSTIMIMDTGIDVKNPAFAGKIKYQLDLTGTGIQDTVGHGSNVAGIAAGARNSVTPTGVAFDANLAVVKLSNSRNVVAGDAANVLAWAADKPDIVVANLSANTAYSAAYTASVKQIASGIFVSNDANYGGKNYYNLENPMAWANAMTPKLAVTVSAGNQSNPYPQNPATFATATDDRGNLLLNGQMLIVGNWNAQAGRVEGAQAGHVCKNVSGTSCLDRYRTSDFYILAPGMLVNGPVPASISATEQKAMSGTSQAAPAVAGAIAVVNQLWPYMSARDQVQLLLKTANKNLPNYDPNVMGQGLLDLDRATQPVGNLGIALNGRTNSTVPLTGGISISNPGANSIATFGSIAVVDDLKRDFRVNMSGAINANSMNKHPVMIDADPGASWSSRWTGLISGQTLQQPLLVAQNSANSTVTIDSRLFNQTSPTTHQLTVTNSQYNPYVYATGSFGETKHSVTTEYNVLHQPGDKPNRNSLPQGWWAQGGAMMTNVYHSQGLIDKITPIVAVHAITGYQHGNWNMFAGIKPTVVSGAVHFNVPTAVDEAGTMYYSNVKNNLAAGNPISYAGVKYQFTFSDTPTTRHLLGFRAVVAQDGTRNARAYYIAQF